MAVGCGDGSILLHDLGGTDESPSKLLGHEKAVFCLCLLPEEVLASGSWDENDPGLESAQQGGPTGAQRTHARGAGPGAAQ